MRVLVTGGTKGLGKTIAGAFLKQGAIVGINYHKDDHAFEEFFKPNKFKKNILRLKYDVCDKDQVRKMFQTIKKEWGSIDVLINNAGITVSKLLSNISCHDFENIFGVNLLGPMYCVSEAETLMKKQKDGHIINISSINGINGGYGLSVYSMTKAGLIGYSKQKAKELGEFNIKVNVVIPGFLETGMTSHVSCKEKERIVLENVLGRISNPEQIAEFIVKLCREQNISGQVFNLDSRIY